ncbi:MAG: biopolymer transporter ExbD [Lentisphaeria bacterium]|jgi:biopolymer transport protein ExbD
MRRIRPNVRPFAGRLDLVPFLNVMFLLLIFFAISSSFVFHAGVPVELPAVVAPEMRATDKLVVTITRGEQLFFNDKPISWEEFEREFLNLVYDTRKEAAIRAARTEPDRARPVTLLLRADREVPYNRIMAVIAVARSRNLNVFLATDARPALGGGAVPPVAQPPAGTPGP